MASLNLSSASASASCLSLFLISVISIHLSKYPVDGISKFSPNLSSASASASASVGSVATTDIKDYGIMSTFWRGLELVEGMLYGDANIVQHKSSIAALELKHICCKNQEGG